MSKTVLVIDDDNLVRRTLGNLLRSAGLVVEEAENGKLGLDAALKSHPDLIVTDIHMPEMNGHEMIDALRKDEWGKKVSIIVLSTDESMGSINKALEAGVTFYLDKTGTDPDTLVTQVMTALG